MENSDLKKFISLVVERRLREADITDGKTDWGSDEHVSDLRNRIEDLTKWRDRQRKGTEARANYARLITRLRSELKSAERLNLKAKAKSLESDE